MRKYIFTLLAAFCTFAGFAQTANDAFYIYRNDGGFNAFLKEDVDSMTYSTYNADSVQFSDYVTQIVYTKDSVYWIPLVAIDSVSFVKPVTSYKNRVIRMNDMLQYVDSARDMTIYFNTSLPVAKMPHQGDILIYEGSNAQFQLGFAGRVADITNKDGYIVTCDSVMLDDIYDRLVLYGKYDLVADTTQQAPHYHLVKRRANGSTGDLKLSYTFGGGAGDTEAKATVSSTIGAMFDVTLLKQPGQPTYMNVLSTFKEDFDVNASVSTGWSADLLLPFSYKVVPIPACPAIVLVYKAGFFMKPSITGALSLDENVHAQESLGFIYSNKQFSVYKKPVMVTHATTAPTVDLTGSLYCGVMNGLSVGVIGGIVQVGTNFYVGPKISVDFKIDATKVASGSLYDELKGSEAKCSFDAEAEVKASANIGPMEIAHFDLAKWDLGIELNKWYMLPAFSEPKYTKGKESTIGVLKTTVSRDLLPKVDVGLALYDKDGNFVSKQYSAGQYRLASQFTMNPYEASFSGLKPGCTYTCYPLVKVMGHELRATPKKEFTVDVTVTTGAATNLKQTSVTLAGYADGLQSGQTIGSAGICYTTNASASTMSDWTFVQSTTTADGDFTVNLSNLLSSTTYYYCSYLFLDGKYRYGEVKTFTTPTPSVITLAATDITKTSVTLNADAGENFVLSTSGFLYNTTGNPTETNATTVNADGGADGKFYTHLSGLTANTTYYFRAYQIHSGNNLYGAVQTFTTTKNDDTPTPGDAIDLGLSVKWASCNVGATSPEGYGGYYAWGETEEKSDYDRDTYIYYNSSTDTWVDIGSNICGTSYDVAHVKWGGSWRLPTLDEQKELVNKCTYKWTTYNGVAGGLFTGPNGNSIFLPAAGNRNGTDVDRRGIGGFYWSGTLYYSSNAIDLGFNSGSAYWVGSCACTDGFSVRPVSE